MCKKYFDKVTQCHEAVFSCWGGRLHKRGWLVLLISAIVMVGLSIGMINASNFDDQAKAGTPLDSLARDNLDTFNGLDFPKFKSMGYIYRAANNENVITIAHF